MRRTALIGLLLVVAALVAGAGCGSSAESDEERRDDNQNAAPIATSQVVTQFKRSSGGTRLRETPAPDAAWDQLGLGLNATPAQQRRYGTFTIYVVKPERMQAVQSLLSDKETSAPLDRAAGGIYWDFDELAGSYVAHKRYGPNVVLAWWNERPEPAVDARWRRLDALLQDLLAG